MKEIYSEHVIAYIEFSERIEVVFYFDYYNGKIWANIRKFVKSKKYIGPTKQGIKFDPAKLPELKKAFENAKSMEATIFDEEFLRFPKSPKRDIVVHASVYKGALGVDLREWLHTEKYTGWTKHGVRFPIDLVPQVIIALQQMSETKPALGELTNQTKNDFNKSDNLSPSLEGVPQRLRHLFHKEDNNDK